FLMRRPPPLSSLFPYTTLFRSLEIRNQYFDAAVGRARASLADRFRENRRAAIGEIVAVDRRDDDIGEAEGPDRAGDALGLSTIGDRKSTRLNSSHVAISYAVFC